MNGIINSPSTNPLINYMFGLNKIKEAQKKAEDLKLLLSEMNFEGESLNGMVKAVCSGSKNFYSIKINESVFKIREQADIEQMIVEAINEAITKAEITAKQKMTSILPTIPGLKF